MDKKLYKIRKEIDITHLSKLIKNKAEDDNVQKGF